MKSLRYLYWIVITLTAVGCGSGIKDTEHIEETVAQIETAQVEGRGAARRIINEHFSDSIALQAAVLQANAGRSRYEIENKPRCAAAYDSAFISTIRTVRPELAAQLEK